MNLLSRFKAVLCLFSILIWSSCKKNSAPNCGCDAATRTTIQESANFIGTIYFSGPQTPIANAAFFQNKYFIVFSERDCVNCVHTMIVCNEAILPQKVLELKLSNQSLQVKFAGNLKPFCTKIVAPGDYTYEDIVLTKIEVQ